MTTKARFPKHKESPMRRMRVTLLIVAVSLFLRCGRSTTGSPHSGTNGEEVTTARGRDGVEVKAQRPKGDNAKTAPKQGAVAPPDYFAKDVPIYPGATIVVGRESQVTTADTVRDVVAFYTDKLKENGWKIVRSSVGPKGSILSARKTHLYGSSSGFAGSRTPNAVSFGQRRRTVIVEVARSEGGTTIGVVLEESTE